MARATMTFEVRFAWWFVWLYLYPLMAVMTTCRWLGFDSQPDWDKVWHIARKAIIVTRVKD